LESRFPSPWSITRTTSSGPLISSGQCRPRVASESSFLRQQLCTATQKRFATLQNAHKPTKKRRSKVHSRDLACCTIPISFSSSDWLATRQVPLDENSKLGCLNPYGRTKLFVEVLGPTPSRHFDAMPPPLAMKRFPVPARRNNQKTTTRPCHLARAHTLLHYLAECCSRKRKNLAP